MKHGRQERGEHDASAGNPCHEDELLPVVQGHQLQGDPGQVYEGNLAIILDEPRQLDLIAEEDSQFLRIGAEQFRAVIGTDTSVLMKLLQTVASHLTGAAELLREARVNVREAAQEYEAAQNAGEPEDQRAEDR